MVKRVYYCQGKTCLGCRDFLPHEHPDRLDDRLPKAKILWPCAHGDIAFADSDFVHRIITKVKGHADEYDKIYWQSKNPSCFKNYLGKFPGNSIILTTLETNRDSGYRKISRAPFPSQRISDFADIKWPAKIITIEPVYDFDLDEMENILKNVRPVGIWIGYNSKNPKKIGIDEPVNEKVNALIAFARKTGIDVRLKTIRAAYRRQS